MPPFRKERHATEIPKFATGLIRSGGYYSHTGWVSWYGKKLFNFDELHQALRACYSRIITEETEAVIEILIQENVITPTFTPSYWRIVPQSQTPAAPPYKPALAVKKGEKYRRRMKPGECPICGCLVQHKRRHNNRIHSREDCQAMIINKILSE